MGKAHYKIPACGNDLDFLVATRDQIEKACRDHGPGQTMVLCERSESGALPSSALEMEPACTVGEALVVVNNLIWTELGVRPAKKETR